MLLPGVGEEGQEKLLASKALIVGCGALGTVVASTLARAGVGHLVIADRDHVEITNLQRQILFNEDDVENAMPKAQAARQKIATVNSQVRVTAVVDDVNHKNVEKIAEGCGIIIDGVDNFETRFLVNDVAVKHGIPYMYGGAVGSVGMSFAILPHTSGGDSAWERVGAATPCLRCIFEKAPPPGMNPTCDTAGVLAPVVNVIASCESAEAIKILTGNWGAISPTILHVDLWANTFRQFHAAGAYDLVECICCRQRRFEFLEGEFASEVTRLCGRDSVQIAQGQGNGHKLDFDALARRLERCGTVRMNPFMLRADIVDGGKSYQLMLFPDGRAIIKGTREANTAKGIYAKYVGA